MLLVSACVLATVTQLPRLPRDELECDSGAKYITINTGYM